MFVREVNNLSFSMIRFCDIIPKIQKCIELFVYHPEDYYNFLIFLLRRTKEVDILYDE